MKYRLIDRGVVIDELEREYDGSLEANERQIQGDMYGQDADPLLLARKGEQVTWVEGRAVE